MKLLKQLLMEAYHSISDDITGLDRDFAEYAMNEVALRWSPEDVDRARDMFGRVDVGEVYRGMKIQTNQQLQEIKRLSEQGGFVDMQLESATPHWSTAASFANYVKSYNELTTMRALNTAIKNGSAGAFGTAILTLVPTREQVIVKTYTTSNETKQNPNWRRPTQSAENEVILNGSIRCVAASIIPPLTKSNWKETLMSTVTSVRQIQDWSLLDQWLDANNIPRSDVEAVAHQIWAKVIRTSKDLVDALNCSRLNPASYIERQPKLMKWLAKNIVHQNNQFYVELDRNRIRITKNTGLANRAWLMGKQTIDGAVVKNISVVERKLIDSLEKYGNQLGSPGIRWLDEMSNIKSEYTIVECIRFVTKYKRKLTDISTINQMITIIQSNVDDQLKFMANFVSNIHHDPKPTIGGINGLEFANQLIELLSIAHEFPKLATSRKQLIKAIYNMVPTGKMDDNKRELLDWWTSNIGQIIK